VIKGQGVRLGEHVERAESTKVSFARIAGDLLNWLGYVVGLVAGLLEFWRFRCDRRADAAYKQLLDEARRDRKAIYTEEQAAKLRDLAHALERSVRKEIPLQARRAFVESQIEATSDTILSSVRQYERLSGELHKLQRTPKRSLLRSPA